MAQDATFLRQALFAFVTLAGLCASVRAGLPASDEALVVRVVHPERQAAEILSLFQGTRAPHPAWALAAWKRATRNPGQLGKPLEAVIACFNPEMVPEWRIFHEAELHLDLSRTDGKPSWYAVVPRDDGTAAAGISAKRLTDGADEQPLAGKDGEHAVVRLGASGAPLTLQVGDALIVASSRDRLACGLNRIQTAGVADALDAGLHFRLDMARVAPPAHGSLELRRVLELLRGLGCHLICGQLALKGERLALEVTTSFDRDDHRPGPGTAAATVQPSWLEGLSSSGVMAVVCLALEPRAEEWNRVFALADRVERLDPARADVAPLRTRFNLVASTARAHPEAELWPHLRGLTLCLVGDWAQPGRPAGALLGLHVDSESSAERLTGELIPRVCAHWALGRTAALPRPAVSAPPSAAGTVPEKPRRLGRPGGRALEVCRRGQNVWIGWGDGVLEATLKTAESHDCSLSAVCTGWEREGKQAPSRLGAIWPARCWLPVRTQERESPALGVLAENPPAIWWGWSGATTAVDSIHWSGLKERARRFLDRVPLDPAPTP